mgnify:CR=1 FL=1
MPEIALKFRTDIDTEVVVKKINILLQNLKQSLGSFGANIQLIDTNKIKNDISNIDKVVTNINANAKNVNKSVEQLASGLGKAANQGNILARTFQFNQFAQAISYMTGALNQFVTPFVALDKQVQNIGTLLAGTGRDFKEFTDLSIQLSKKVPDSAAELAGAIYQTISAGIGTTNEEVIKFTEVASKAAVAGVSTTEAAVDGLSSVVNAYKNSVGGAKMSLDDTNKIADTFFAAIKLGKTTFNEMNAAIASWVPMASALGLSFDQGAAAIANLTAQGTPTAQVATQMNAAFTLISKGTGPLNKALEGMGMKLEDLREMLQKPAQEGGGLINVLKTIREAAERSGQTVAAITGRVEAAKLIESLAGTNEKVLASVQVHQSVMDEISKGAATQAYEVAAEGVEVKTKILLNKVQAMFSSAFQALGSGATTTLNVLTQLSPAILSFAGMKQIIPAGALTNLKNLPQMFNNVLPAVQRLSTGILSLIPGFVATGAVGTSTGTATATAWMSALAPILLIIAAIGLIVGAFVLLYKHVEGFKNTVDAVFQVVAYTFERIWEVLQRVGGIIVAFGGAIFEFLIAPFKIAWGVITGIIEAIFGVGDSTQAAEEHMKLLDIVFNALLKTLSYVEAALKGVQAFISSIVGSVVNVVGKVLKGDFIGAIEEMGKAGENAGAAFMDGFNSTMSENAVKDALESMNRQVEGGLKLKAKMEIDSEALVSEYESIQNKIEELKNKNGGLTEKEKTDLATLETKSKSIAQEIGKILPETKQNVQLIADSNGKLVESYDININKAKELSKSQNELYDSKLSEAQSRYSDDLKVIADEYDVHKKKLEDIQVKANEAAKTGNKEEVRKLTKEYEEQSKKVAEIGQNLLKSYGEGAKAGLVNEQTQKRITEQLKLSDDVNQKIKTGQIDLNSAVEDTEDSVKSLGDAFEEAMSKAKSAQQEAIGSLAQLKIQLKQGKLTQAEYEKERAKYLNEGIKATKELKDYTAAQKEAEKEIGIEQKSTTTSRKTNTDLADKEYQATKKRIELETKSKELTLERNRLEAGREKNNADELIYNDLKLQALKEQFSALEKIYKLSKTESEFKVGIKLKGTAEEIKNQSAKVIDEATSLVNSIAEQENKALELKLKASIDEKKSAQELKEKIQQLNESELEFKIKMGLAKPEDMLKLIESQITELQKELDDKVTKGFADTKEEQEYIELQSKMLALRSKAADKKKEINDKELRDLQEKHQRELAIIEQSIDTQKKLTDILIQSTENAFTKKFNDNKEKELEQIEEQKKLELITEEEAKRKKEELEFEHQKKIASIQAAARGEQLEAERQLTLQLLQEQEARLKAEISLLDPDKDADKYKELSNKLAGLQSSIQEKGDLIQAYSIELQSGITETFQNLFTGDEESIKAPFRKVMATLAGVLKQIASAVVTKLVLDQLALTPGGFAAMIAIPAIKGIISGAVNLILSPILDKLLSFAWGGRIDEPTLAIIGDKSRAGGSTDREWVLWDEHIIMIIDQALSQYHKVMMKYMAGDMSVNKFKDMAIIPLYMEIRNLSNSINSLKPYLSKLSINDLIELVNEKNAVNELERKLFADLISYDQFKQQIALKELRIRSLASGGVAFKPEIVQIGDAGVNNPEYVLNSPQLDKLITSILSTSNKQLEKKIDQLITAVYETKDVYIDNRKVTDEIIREMNRRKK